MKRVMKRVMIQCTILLFALFLLNACASEQSAFKIGIMTGSKNQNADEYLAAKEIQDLYGAEHVVIQTYAENFVVDYEITIDRLVTMARDPEVKALIICQGVKGTNEAIRKIKEFRDDILFVVGIPGEDPYEVAKLADIVVEADKIGMGKAMALQAKRMGATTFVHYSFPRHLENALIQERKEELQHHCELNGLTFIDRECIDPLDVNYNTEANEFILSDVAEVVAKHGKDTAFFVTNCYLQVPLIQAVLNQGAIYPQPCCPSPYHGFTQALGIDLNNENMGDVSSTINEITERVHAAGCEGRVSTWPLSLNRIAIHAGSKYGIMYAKGEITSKFDPLVFESIMRNSSKIRINISNLHDEKGIRVDNYFLILVDYLTF